MRIYQDDGQTLSNNASGVKEPAPGAKLCVANEGFNHDILRMLLSDLDAPLK